MTSVRKQQKKKKLEKQKHRTWWEKLQMKRAHVYVHKGVDLV